jgi:hypothetical protein
VVDNPDHVIQYPLAKAATAIAGASAVNLANLAQWVQIGAGLMAGLYSAILIGEWLVKRLRAHKHRKVHAE